MVQHSHTIGAFQLSSAHSWDQVRYDDMVWYGWYLNRTDKPVSQLVSPLPGGRDMGPKNPHPGTGTGPAGKEKEWSCNGTGMQGGQGKQRDRAVVVGIWLPGDWIVA